MVRLEWSLASSRDRSFLSVLELAEFSGRRKRPEIQRSHVHRSELWLQRFGRCEPAAETHAAPAAGRDVHDCIAVLPNGRQKSAKRLEIPRRRAAFFLALMQMQNRCARSLARRSAPPIRIAHLTWSGVDRADDGAADNDFVDAFHRRWPFLLNFEARWIVPHHLSNGLTKYSGGGLRLDCSVCEFASPASPPLNSTMILTSAGKCACDGER